MQRATSKATDAVKTGHLKEALACVIHDLGFGRRNARFAQNRKRKMFGQQQVTPALADGAVLQFAKLYNHMTCAFGSHGISGEFRLFASG